MIQTMPDGTTAFQARDKEDGSLALTATHAKGDAFVISTSRPDLPDLLFLMSAQCIALNEKEVEELRDVLNDHLLAVAKMREMGGL